MRGAHRAIALIVLVVAGTAAVAGFTAWLSKAPVVSRVLTRFVPPSPPSGGAPLASEREREALRELGRHVRGRLLWASNRGGNHDLYEGDLSTGRVVRLTDHPHVDFFGRYSPDGSRIAFLRSRRPWVSFREVDGWDLFVMDARGGGVSRLAERVYHPAWTSDGSALTLLRDNAVVVLSLVDGAERVLHEGDMPPTGGDIGSAEQGPEGQLAITLRRVPTRRRGIGVLAPAQQRYHRVGESPSACQAAWTPSGGLVWIEGEGNGGNRVMHASRPEASAQVLIDLPGRYSHEYFPRVSADGAWLTWGAAAEGHEHDRADYEIFAWRIGTSWSSARRLTYSEANDQWPELRLD